MQVIYYLIESKTDKQGNAPIFYSITFNGERIRRKIKDVKVKTKDWNENAQRVKPSPKREDYNYFIEYNKIIEELDQRIKTIFRLILLNDLRPTKDYILEKLDSVTPIDLTYNFLDSFQEFIDKSKLSKAERTIKSYVTTLNYLKEFEKETSIKLDFETLDYNFFETFREYSFNIKRIKNNYFAKLTTILKTFMTWAADREYHQNFSFKKFKAKEDETEVIYLTLSELMRLYNHEFESKKLAQVRDVYCFCCFTGLRYSDVKQLRQSNIYDGYLKLNIQKTKTIDHTIPLNAYARAILDKYVDTIYEPLPIISSQKFNKYLKDCAADVDIDKPTTITRYVGTKRIDTTVPKSDLITSHTARKTFVTNSLVLGMKEMVLRNITGHKKEESFRRYVKIAEDLKKQEMNNTWDNIK